jgi:hypothetical protein
MSLYQFSLIVGSVCTFALAVAGLIACLHPRAFHIGRNR